MPFVSDGDFEGQEPGWITCSDLRGWRQQVETPKGEGRDKVVLRGSREAL